MGFFDGQEFTAYGSYPSYNEKVQHYPVYYGIQYNHCGSFWLRINKGQRYEMSGAYVFFTYPDTYFEYGNLSDELRHHNYICCQGERIDQYIESSLMVLDKVEPVWKINNPEKFLEQMQKIMSLLNSSLPVIPPRAVLLYEELLLMIQENGQSAMQTQNWHSPDLMALVRQIRIAPEYSWDFHEQAESFHMTTTHFRRLFKNITNGIPPQQFLLQCRLRLAASKLLQTNKTISEIGKYVGIEDEFYFSKLFKKKYSISPSQYRKDFTIGSPLF